jgi:DNA-binding NtrC family response regulator
MQQAMATNVFTTAERFEQAAPERENHEPPGELVVLGESIAVRRLRSQIRRIAPYFRIALIRGETGSGKELVARCLHAGSPGADGPFIVARADALAGAFARDEPSRMARMRPAVSLLESAHGGTLFLKDVGDLSFGLQAGLLEFLRACEELHGADPGTGRTRIDRADSRARILAASSRDLHALALIGQFRQDLYAHLSAVEIHVPPLRQRVEDIPAIGEWLLHRLAEQTRQSPKLLAEATVAQLQKATWPDNLRELERVICQAAALAEGGSIELRHLLALVEPGFAHPAAIPTVKLERLHDVIQQHMFDVLGRCGGNKLRAAEALGISRSTLYRMLDAASESSLPQRPVRESFA